MIEDPDAWLAQVGFDQDAVDAMNRLWATNHLDPLLDVDAKAMRYAGHNAAETLDAVRHKLPEVSASLYYENGFTAHQASLIKGSEQAEANIYERTLEGVDDILKSDGLPRDYVVNILLISANAAEVDDFVRRYRAAANGTPETHQGTSDGTPDNLAARIAHLSAYRNPPIPDCCA